MKVYLILGTALVMWALPATSQTTTTCIGDQMIVCQTSAPPPRLEERDTTSERTAAENMRNLFRGDPKKRAGKLLAAGDCDAALEVALKAGDFELVDRVEKFCRRKERRPLRSSQSSSDKINEAL